jgi:hypothetical protein
MEGCFCFLGCHKPRLAVKVRIRISLDSYQGYRFSDTASAFESNAPLGAGWEQEALRSGTP